MESTFDLDLSLQMLKGFIFYSFFLTFEKLNFLQNQGSTVIFSYGISIIFLGTFLLKILILL